MKGDTAGVHSDSRLSLPRGSWPTLSPRHLTRTSSVIPDAAPSSRHLLGTDELGRDRLARLLYGTRVSLLLAPLAALLSAILAGLIGGTAGFFGGWYRSFVMAATDLFLSLPWLFLLITVRALLPLNVSPLVSVVITFGLLGCLGWAGAARVICAEAQALSSSEFILMARSTGSSGFRLLWRHVIPNLKPVLFAQFWISIPVFILTEANLGILGLGVAEPLPSWGTLLQELERPLVDYGTTLAFRALSCADHHRELLPPYFAKGGASATSKA